MKRPPVNTIHVFVFSVIALAVLAAGCSKGGSASSVADIADTRRAFPEGQADVPFVFIYTVPGYTAHASDPGVLAAVWPDGAMVRVVSSPQAGTSYIKGRLTAAQVGEVRRIFGDSGILAMPTESYVVIDAVSEEVTVRWGKTVHTWAHSPGFENTGNAASTNSRITDLKKRLLAITPADSVPEPAERWANYQHSWYK